MSRNPKGGISMTTTDIAPVLLATTLALSPSAALPALSEQSGAMAGKNMTSPEQASSGSSDVSHFTYSRIYCTPDGSSHFATVTVELREVNFAPPAAPLYIGGQAPASSTFFGGFESGWGAGDLEHHLYHPAPAAQFIVVLKGNFSITTTDGENRQFRAGDVLRLEDPPPCTGHITVVGDAPGFFMFVR